MWGKLNQFAGTPQVAGKAACWLLAASFLLPAEFLDSAVRATSPAETKEGDSRLLGEAEEMIAFVRRSRPTACSRCAHPRVGVASYVTAPEHAFDPLNRFALPQPNSTLLRQRGDPLRC
jgi:hypothetical protein